MTDRELALQRLIDELNDANHIYYLFQQYWGGGEMIVGLLIIIILLIVAPEVLIWLIYWGCIIGVFCFCAAAVFAVVVSLA